jgi:hypothetical protein
MHVGSHYGNVRAHRRERDVISVILARRYSIILSHMEPTHDFEPQVATLVTQVTGVQEILEYSIHITVRPKLIFTCPRFLQSELASGTWSERLFGQKVFAGVVAWLVLASRGSVCRTRSDS